MFKLAWRNIWRNKRRMLITIASIFFAMFFAVLMRSFQLGSYTNMIGSVVETYSGHLQIQQKDYFKTPTINNSLAYTNELRKSIETIPEIVNYDARIISGLLASSGEQSKLGIVIGVEPEKSDKLTNIENKIINIYISEKSIQELKNKGVDKKIIKKIEKLQGNYYKDETDLQYELILTKKEKEAFLETIIEKTKFEGEYLTKNDKDILIAYKLARFLELNVGDSLIIMGQGYHGATAVGKYRIKAFLKFPGLEFNNSMIYMTLKNSQLLFSAYEVADNNTDTTFLVNYIAVNTKYQISLKSSNDDKILSIKNKLEKNINNEDLSVIFWKKNNKELIQQVGSDNVSGQMMLAILYLIIAFGVFGTVLMMVSERKRELGVMIAIGMKKIKLSIIVTLEMLFIGIIAIISGAIATIPIILYGYYFPIRMTGDMAKAMEQWNIEPIMPMQWFDLYYLNQAVVVVFIVLIAIIYPVIKILNLKVIKALRT